jgi:hypothetical protein
MNTVASVLGTGHVQRHAAEAIDRNSHAVARSEQVLSRKNQQHAEEIEDPGDQAMEAIRDEHRRQGQSQQQKRDERAAHVEIEGVETPDAAASDSPPPAAHGGLDISA